GPLHGWRAVDGDWPAGGVPGPHLRRSQATPALYCPSSLCKPDGNARRFSGRRPGRTAVTTTRAEPQSLALAAGVAAWLGRYYARAFSAAAKKGMTFAEMAHLPGGYTYWASDDSRLHPENGNWPQRLGALPAIISGAAFPRRDQPAWITSNVYAIG